MKYLIFITTTAVLLSGCQTYQDAQSRRSKLAQFVLSHPVAAKAIGVQNPQSDNITSNAFRLAERSGLDDQANGTDSRGTQVNAVRNTLWQAAITAQFGSDIAQQVGDAYLSDTTERPEKTAYYSRLAADQAVDLRNNRIGRQIGSHTSSTDIKTLAQMVLQYYRQTGLWSAQESANNGRRIWRIQQSQISEEAYQKALQQLKPLTTSGMTVDEEKQAAPSTLRDIGNSVKAIKQVDD